MKKSRRIWVLIATSALCVMVMIAIFVIETQKPEPDLAILWQTISLSVLCSIVASFIFLYIQRGAEYDESIEVSRAIQSIEDKLKDLDVLYDSGIKSVRRKSFYDQTSNFWGDMLEKTNDRLDLIGHSISHWLDDEYKELFCNKITNMISKGKTVRILLSNDNGTIDQQIICDGLARQSRTTPMTKVDNTCYELAKLVGRVNKKYRGNLKLYITKRSVVTYMYIRTDRQCFISPYISSPANNSNTFLLELDTGVEYSKCFEQDFKEMINAMQCIKWE